MSDRPALESGVEFVLNPNNQASTVGIVGKMNQPGYRTLEASVPLTPQGFEEESDLDQLMNGRSLYRMAPQTQMYQICMQIKSIFEARGYPIALTNQISHRALTSLGAILLGIVNYSAKDRERLMAAMRKTPVKGDLYNIYDNRDHENEYIHLMDDIDDIAHALINGTTEQLFENSETTPIEKELLRLIAVITNPYTASATVTSEENLQILVDIVNRLADPEFHFQPMNPETRAVKVNDEIVRPYKDSAALENWADITEARLSKLQFGNRLMSYVLDERFKGLMSTDANELTSPLSSKVLRQGILRQVRKDRFIKVRGYRDRENYAPQYVLANQLQTPEELDVFFAYAERLMNPSEEVALDRILVTNQGVVNELKQRIDAEKDSNEKIRLKKIYEALGYLVQSYEETLDDLIDENQLRELELHAQDVLNNVNGDPETSREGATVLFVNGYNTGGKSTLLKLMEIFQRTETGTTGVLGHLPAESTDEKGFDQYTELVEANDIARATRGMLPDKLMRLLFLMDILEQRAILDAEGKVNEPVVISGFPRSLPQTWPFLDKRKEKFAVNNFVSIALKLDEEEAMLRTLTRFAEDMINDKEIREDDQGEFEPIKTDDGDLFQTIRRRIERVDGGITRLKELYKADRGALTELLRDLLVNLVPEKDEENPRLKFSQTSRFSSFKKGTDDVIKALKGFEIETVVINTTSIRPKQVLQELSRRLPDVNWGPNVPEPVVAES